jgi:SHS2 domain-containing protein
MNGSFEILEHQADVRILAKGSNQASLYESALKGLCEVILPGSLNYDVSKNFKREIEIESVDITTLLIDFLSEVLFLSHQNKALFCRVNFLSLTESYLEAEIFGFKIDKFDEDVKAVTYHEADVVFTKGYFQTVIVLDI